MAKVVLFSPSYPTGGISSWTHNVLEYIYEHQIQDICYVDASIYLKNAKYQTNFRRLLSGILDTLFLVFHFTKALIK